MSILTMRKVIYVLIALCSFVVGINITMYFYIEGYNIGKQIDLGINPLEIFSLCINVFLAIYVGNVITRRQDNEKSEKEAVINYLHEFKSRLADTVVKTMQSPNFQSVEVLGDMSTLRNRWKIVEDVISVSNLKIDDTEQKAIRLLIRNIWSTFTTVPSGTLNPVVQRSFTISTAEINLLDAEKLILELTFRINRL